MRYTSLELYTFELDGFKSCAYAYDAKTRLYLRKHDSGIIKFVPYGEFEKIVKQLAEMKR